MRKWSDKVWITLIICITITLICLICSRIVTANKQKLKDIKSVANKFRDSYVEHNNDKNCYVYAGTADEVMNFLCIIERLTNAIDAVIEKEYFLNPDENLKSPRMSLEKYFKKIKIQKTVFKRTTSN